MKSLMLTIAALILLKKYGKNIIKKYEILKFQITIICFNI